LLTFSVPEMFCSITNQKNISSTGKTNFSISSWFTKQNKAKIIIESLKYY